MARPYSYDLRSRVATRLMQGHTCRETATTFDISVATAVRIGQQFRRTGSAAAKPMGGVHRDVLAGHRDWLRARLSAVPDVTLRTLQTELANRGAKVSRWAVWKFCQDDKLSF